MTKDIFELNPNKTETYEEYYCLIDNADYMDEDGFPRLENSSEKVMSKKIQKQDARTQFAVRIGYDGKLYDPLSVLSSKKNLSSLDRNSQGIKFKLVNETVFLFYNNYLTNKNIAWFNRAEREIM